MTRSGRPSSGWSSNGSPLVPIFKIPVTAVGKWGRGFYVGVDRAAYPKPLADGIEAARVAREIDDAFAAYHRQQREDEFRSVTEDVTVRTILTPHQRALASARWSSLLRAKVKASKERERNQILVQMDELDW